MSSSSLRREAASAASIPLLAEVVTVTACLPVHGPGHGARRSKVTKEPAESRLSWCASFFFLKHSKFNKVSGLITGIAFVTSRSSSKFIEVHQLFFGGGLLSLAPRFCHFLSPAAGVRVTTAACTAGPITPPLLSHLPMTDHL